MIKKCLVLMQSVIIREKGEGRRVKNFTHHPSRFTLPLMGLVIGIGLMFFAGCSASLSRLEVDRGTSHALAKLNQTLDPEAGKKSEPVYGLNGQAAQEAVGKYLKGFESKDEASTKTLLSTSK